MKKVCIITAARSEYGVLRWIIDLFSHDKDIQLQLIVTGSHLSKEFGLTYHFIEEDGYKIDEKVDMELNHKIYIQFLSLWDYALKEWDMLFHA